MTDELSSDLEALAEVAKQLALFNRARSTCGADVRWLELDPETEGQVEAKRVLVVGADVSDDAAAFVARGARYVLACPSPPAIGREDRSGAPVRVEFRQLSWEELDPVRLGTFDVVHCNDLLHRVTEPLLLLQKMRAMVLPGAIFLVRSMMLPDPEYSEYLRFVPDRHAGDPTWWFIPGRLAFRWLVQTAGFEVVSEFGEQEGPRDRAPVAAGYLKAIAR